ncbi:VOC family protein [Winogradskyella maritima]|uniref:VOC family protein n=1 Tax=Winogradskyella maritima TaxID=1517766 RepID=A0ABV8ABZ4_9FLAO|nr:VOC family protein [Winogradskyella maritima]
MKLGAFSISLSVKDIHASKAFYETLGFIQFAGDLERKYLIMKNGDSLVGLFQDMFEGNIITFNPGWDQDAKTLEDFDDVRAIQEQLKKSGVPLIREADTESKGPASIVLQDPDGNNILIDQHV